MANRQPCTHVTSDTSSFAKAGVLIVAIACICILNIESSWAQDDQNQPATRYRALKQSEVAEHFARQHSARQHFARQQAAADRERTNRNASIHNATMRSPHGQQQPPIMRFQETTDRINAPQAENSADLSVLFAKDLQRPAAKTAARPIAKPTAKPPADFRRQVAADDATADVASAKVRPVNHDSADAEDFAMLLPKRGERGPASSKAGGKTPFQLTQKAGIGLAIALSAFFALVWLLKKTGGSSQPQGAIPQQVVQVLGRAPLNTKQNMQLVRLGDKILLLAISTTGTESLGEITDRDEVDAITEICLSRNSRRIKETFRQTLQRIRSDRRTRDHDFGADELRGGSYAV